MLLLLSVAEAEMPEVKEHEADLQVHILPTFPQAVEKHSNRQQVRKLEEAMDELIHFMATNAHFKLNWSDPKALIDFWRSEATS